MDVEIPRQNTTTAYVPTGTSPRHVRLEQYGAQRDAITRTHWRELAEVYSISDTTMVRRFLQAHPHLIEVILEAYPHLVKHFGPDPQVMLKVVRDPEEENENSEQLFAYILTPLPAEEALARLDRLDEEWFQYQFDRVGDLFNFNL